MNTASSFRTQLGARTRAWSEPRWAAAVAFTGAVASFALATPAYVLITRSSWAGILAKQAHPLRHFGADATSHAAKLDVRLTMAFAGHLFHLSVVGNLALLALASLPTLTLLTLVFRRIGAPRADAALVTWSLALAYVGSAFFVDIYGFFDGIALLFVTIAMWSRRAAVIAGATMLALLTDERAVFALVLVVVAAAFEPNRSWRSAAKPIGAGFAATVAVWIGLAAGFGLHSRTTGAGAVVLRGHLPWFPVGVWSALEGAWIVAAAGLALAWRHRARVTTALAIAVTMLASVGAAAVYDFTRSEVYVFPVVIAGVAAIVRFRPEALRRVAIVAALASLLTPCFTFQAIRPAPQWPLPVRVARGSM